jgi:Fur family ferric uptake transcriptional regulator
MGDGRPLRMTESRKAILSALEGDHSHPTADEVYETVRRSIPRISLGTVYRNLDLLAREGLITAISDAGEQRRYDAGRSQHHHVRCEVCGRLDDVTLDDPHAIEQMLSERCGYEIHGYRLCFVGVCGRCSDRNLEAHGPTGGSEKRRSAD